MQIKTIFILLTACFSFLYVLPAKAYEYEDAPDSYATSNVSVEVEASDPVLDDPDVTTEQNGQDFYESPREISGYKKYSSRLPKQISYPGEQLIVVNPRE